MSTAPHPESVEQRILHAADRLFYSRGIQAVGVDAVSAGAGISKRTLYKHFPSKDVLIAAYLARRVAALPDACGAPLDQILAMFDGLEKWLAGKRFRGCPFVNAVSELGADQAHPGVAIAVAAKRRRKEWLASRLSELAVPHPLATAERLVIVFEGAIATSLVLGGDAQVARAARDTARLVLRAAGVADHVLYAHPGRDQEAPQ